VTVHLARGRIARRELLAGTVAVVLAEATRARAEAAPAAPGPPRPLGRFTTLYETDLEHRPRALNVELAAEAVNGRAILPGGLFSFNDVVGERTAAFGFAKSVVLRHRMLAEGMGGGTCQVASTVHAAALLAGLDIVDRTPHSRPSAYIRMGLDATVVYPNVDLKVRNPRVDRFVLRAKAERGTLEVWVEAEGASRPHVTLTSEIVERSPFERSVERDPEVPDGEVHVRAHGIPGYRVLRTREIVTEDGTRLDRRMDHYLPTALVLAVCPSFDLARIDVRDVEERPTGPLRPPVFRDDRGAHVPALVQLRPSDRVVLDNA
jgi:vancomycin resistance protein YoaR